MKIKQIKSNIALSLFTASVLYVAPLATDLAGVSQVSTAMWQLKRRARGHQSVFLRCVIAYTLN